MQRLHTFTLQELQRIIKIAERHLPLFIIIPIFAQCSPFVGLVEKYRALSHLRLIFFLFRFELFPENIWRFQRYTLYLQHPTKYSNNDNDFIKETIFARYGVESGNAPMPYYMA